MIITSNEMAPKTNKELVVASILMVFSSMISANLFGKMAVLSREMNKKTIKF